MSDGLRTVALALALLASCKDSSTAVPEASVSAATLNPSASVASAKPVVPTPLPPPKPHGCVALGLKGATHERDGGVIADAMKVEGRTLSIDEGAKLTVKAISSGREVAFVGRGDALVCRNGDEDEHWLYGGAAEVTTGPPGTETWIVVPGHAVLRFAGAALRAELKTNLTVSVASGTVYVLPMGAVSSDAGTLPDDGGFQRLDVGRSISIAKGTGTAKAAIADCVTAANDARTLAGALVAASADGGFGDLAAKHVAARKRARALCTVALATPGLTAAEKAQAESADNTWRVVVPAVRE